MAGKRKLWATRYDFAGAPRRSHESQAATYRWVREQARLWSLGALRSQRLTVFVDERDGRGYQTYERIDLAVLAAANELKETS